MSTAETKYHVYIEYAPKGNRLWGFSIRIEAPDKDIAAERGIAQTIKNAQAKNDRYDKLTPRPAAWSYASTNPEDYQVTKVRKQAPPR